MFVFYTTFFYLLYLPIPSQSSATGQIQSFTPQFPPMAPSLRSRGWCFTLNNPIDGDEEHIFAAPARYVTFGREVGQHGTPHLQGYIHFDHPQRLQGVKAMLPRNPHLEPRNGTCDQAIAYCQKDGNYVERGERPSESRGREAGGLGNRQRWCTIIERAKLGDTEWLQLNEPKVFVQFMPRLESLRTLRPPVLDGDLINEWWWGPTGTGKSKLLWELYPDHFAKKLNKWWDGYMREDIVAIEEWAPKNEVTGSALKIWADRYPFPGEVKGGTMMHLRPKKIIILSNYSISECFINEQDRGPIQRRFTERKFPDDVPWARQAHLWYNEQHAPPPIEFNLESLSSTDSGVDADSEVSNESTDFDWTRFGEVTIPDIPDDIDLSFLN